VLPLKGGENWLHALHGYAINQIMSKSAGHLQGLRCWSNLTTVKEELKIPCMWKPLETGGLRGMQP